MTKVSFFTLFKVGGPPPQTSQLTPLPWTYLSAYSFWYSRWCWRSLDSHKSETGVDSVFVRCRRLRKFYPFVHRRAASVVAVPLGAKQSVALSRGVVEVLMLNDEVLQTAHVDEPSYTVDTNPFVLPTHHKLASLIAASTQTTWQSVYWRRSYFPIWRMQFVTIKTLCIWSPAYLGLKCYPLSQKNKASSSFLTLN